MAFKVKFAGVDLRDYCTILNVNRSLLPPRINSSKSIPTMNGSYYTGFHYGERIIKLDIFIHGKTKETYAKNLRKLASILNVKSPSKLYISDEPDKYYYAILDGDTTLTREVFSGTSTLTFICHDPLSYSENWNTFIPNGKKIIELNNLGTAPSYPIIDVIFQKKACFFQATNKSGQTVLIGVPKDISKPTINITDRLVDDDCGDITNFSALSPSLLDKDRLVNSGSFAIGANGNGIVCTNFGSGDNSWHGSAFRRSINQDVDEFEVTIDLVFSSQGNNYVPPKPPNPPPPTPNPPIPTNHYGTWKVVNCGGLWINKNANTKEPLYAMSPGTKIYPIESKGIWMKHTHTNKYGTKYTGWSSNKYLKKISNDIVKSKNSSLVSDNSDKFAEDQLGIIEIYGYDKTGAKLFKFELSDNSEWFESVEPKAFIGSSVVLHDSNINSPIRFEQKENGEKQNLPSGSIGKWNDFNGKLIIKREKNLSGDYLWNFTINKYANGKLTSNLTTKNSLSSSSYPKGALNYLGFYIGKYGNKEEVTEMVIDNIIVKKLNIKTDSSIDSNLSLFEPDDNLQINFMNGDTLLNGQSIANEIDIGSIFFEIPSGPSDMIVRSDDETAIVCCGIQERFL